MSRTNDIIKMIGRDDVTYIIAAVTNGKDSNISVCSGGTFENKALLQGVITAEILGIEHTDIKGITKMQKMLGAVKLLLEANE